MVRMESWMGVRMGSRMGASWWGWSWRYSERMLDVLREKWVRA